MAYRKDFLAKVKNRDRRVLAGLGVVAVGIIAAVVLIVRANTPASEAEKAGGEIKSLALANMPVKNSDTSVIKNTSGESSPTGMTLKELNIDLLPVPDTTFAPVGLTVSDGVLYITDTFNKVVWSADADVARVHAGGESVEDIYGEPIGGYNDADLSESLFGELWGIAPFMGGLAVSDPGNQAVRFIDAKGISTVNASSDVLASGELGIEWERPTGLAAGDEGELFVADTDAGRIVVITSDGTGSTLMEKLDAPTGLCYSEGMLYIAETGANRVLRVDIAAGEATVLAGSGEAGDLDGLAERAQFSSPQGIAVADDGSVYIADTVNGAVRRVSDGRVETILGQQDDALETSPVSPTGLFINDGTLYICDRFARQVLVIEL